ncbi:MAG: PIN domain-containing protein [Solirubrobacterales bacterium]
MSVAQSWTIEESTRRYLGLRRAGDRSRARRTPREDRRLGGHRGRAGAGGPTGHRSEGSSKSTLDPLPGAIDLPVGPEVASCFARIAAAERERGRRLRRHDTWIAATAMHHGAAVLTQDADFTSFEEVGVIRV